MKNLMIALATLIVNPMMIQATAPSALKDLGLASGQNAATDNIQASLAKVRKKVVRTQLNSNITRTTGPDNIFYGRAKTTYIGEGVDDEASNRAKAEALLSAKMDCYAKFENCHEIGARIISVIPSMSSNQYSVVVAQAMVKGSNPFTHPDNIFYGRAKTTYIGEGVDDEASNRAKAEALLSAKMNCHAKFKSCHEIGARIISAIPSMSSNQYSVVVAQAMVKGYN